MAIFSKDRTQQGTGNGSTIIAASSELVGNLTLKDTLHVDGRMDGDVESESNVVIGADGYVKGRIHAETVVVSGRVDGSISAGRLEIIAGGCVEGDVHILDLVIEPGGRFNGSSEIRTSPASEAAADDAGPSNDMETPRAAKAKSGGKKPAEPAENSTTGSGGQSPSTA